MQKNAEKAIKEILIINLTRMGDLVQTTPMMAGLREKYPDIKITLLVNSAFTEICRYIPFPDRVFEMDIGRIIKDIESNNLVECYKYIEEILDRINDRVYDITVNFTHSSDSAVLTSLINTREIRGLSLSNDGEGVVKRHPWMRYFFNVIPGRDYNPFHLCDMYALSGGALPSKRGMHISVPADIMEQTEALLSGYGIKENDMLIGFQLGASAEDKRWPVEFFAELSDRISGYFGAKVVLIGSGGETGSGEEFERTAQAKPLNLIGKTNLKELTALLKRCTLLISNDTGPLHIATAVGTKVVDISLASVHFRETGPYAEGSFAIEADIPCSPCSFHITCKDMVCKRIINVNNVFELVRRLLTEGDITYVEDSALWSGLQIYRSYFEKEGLIEYKPLIKRPISKKDLFVHIYRETWLRVLNGEEISRHDNIFQSLMEKLYNWYDIGSVDFSVLIGNEIDALKRLTGLIDAGLARLMLMAGEAKKVSPDITWIKETWEDVPLIEQEMETITYTHPPLKPLSYLFKYSKEELEERELIALSNKACLIYKNLKAHVSAITDILESLRGAFVCL
ncbi:MAG: glycosyltransferase family 9 protein [Nitrospirae bacterium]|nr:glycosyltransferase family 9 protein [Nitrospirota bacterium]